MAAPTAMASLLLPVASAHRGSGATASICHLGSSGDCGRIPPVLPGRRQSLLLLSVAAPFASVLSSARAVDIPLFGLRKKLRTIEEGAVEIVREGEKAVELGIEAAGKEIREAEKEISAAVVGAEEVVMKGEKAVKQRIDTAEKEIGVAAATGLEVGIGGDLTQAGAVVAAEAVGVLAAVSVVNGIIGPEGRSSSS